MSGIASQMSGIAILFIRVAISISLIEARMSRRLGQVLIDGQVRWFSRQWVSNIVQPDVLVAGCTWQSPTAANALRHRMDAGRIGRPQLAQD